jgi:hypothetical protein
MTRMKTPNWFDLDYRFSSSASETRITAVDSRGDESVGGGIVDSVASGRTGSTNADDIVIAIRRTAPRCAAWLFCGVLLILTAGRAAGQRNEPSAADLIKRLGQPTLQEQMGLDPCSSIRKNRAEAMSLVKHGASAIPDLERAIDSIEAHGEESPFAVNARWLILPYAQILGRAAYPRLHRMMGDPQLLFLRRSLDGAVVVSLDLTGYVSDTGVPARVIHCDRRAEPRDALNGVTLAWERKDRQSLETHLGPNARAALNSLLNASTWAKVIGAQWPAKSSGSVAVGYRFELSDRWSEPEDWLTDSPRHGDGTLAQSDSEIETLLKDRSGGDCGRRRIKFIRLPADSAGEERYVVDNTDVGDLLRSITRCAGETTK